MAPKRRFPPDSDDIGSNGDYGRTTSFFSFVRRFSAGFSPPGRRAFSLSPYQSIKCFCLLKLRAITAPSPRVNTKDFRFPFRWSPLSVCSVLTLPLNDSRTPPPFSSRFCRFRTILAICKFAYPLLFSTLSPLVPSRSPVLFETGL